MGVGVDELEMLTVAKKLPGYLSDGAVKLLKSAIHGRGLIAQMELPARRRIGVISGKLVKLPEGRRAVENLPVIYFVELTSRWALDCSEGNKFKHINHSCRPNCYLRIAGKRVVEIYTLRKIPAKAELTCDYSLTPHKNGMTCRCGHSNCKGKL